MDDPEPCEHALELDRQDRDARYTDALCDAADAALASGEPTIVVGYDIAAVPDVYLAERLANGDEVPETYKLIRNDEREVHLYQLPPGLLAASS
jgi:hypothetical protein